MEPGTTSGDPDNFCSDMGGPKISGTRTAPP